MILLKWTKSYLLLFQYWKLLTSYTASSTNLCCKYHLPVHFDSSIGTTALLEVLNCICFTAGAVGNLSCNYTLHYFRTVVGTWFVLSLAAWQCPTTEALTVRIHWALPRTPDSLRYHVLVLFFVFKKGKSYTDSSCVSADIHLVNLGGNKHPKQIQQQFLTPYALKGKRGAVCNTTFNLQDSVC